MEQEDEGSAESIELTAFQFLRYTDEGAPAACVTMVVLADRFVAHILRELKKSREYVSTLKPPLWLWIRMLLIGISFDSLCNISSNAMLVDRVRHLYALCVDNFPEVRDVLKHIVVSAFVAARLEVMGMGMAHLPCEICYRLHPAWTAQFIKRPDGIVEKKS